MDDLEQRGTRVLAFKRKYVGQHLVKQYASRKDVGSQINVSSVNLLRGHILNTSHELAGARDVFRSDASNSKIHQLDGPILQQHDVAGFNIAMHNALLMRICQSIANLDHYAQFFFQ